jgi:hypothetical protein
MSNKTMIIVHHSGMPGSTFATIKHTHTIQNGWPKVGYHKVVQQNGQVFLGREDFETGIHTVNHNAHSLGICLCGDFNTQSVSLAQWYALVEVVARWCKKHDIVPSASTVVGHKDKQATKTIDGVVQPNTCPGANLYSRLPQLRHDVIQTLSTGRRLPGGVYVW